MGALKLFIIAGEPSGDNLGAALMGGLKALSPDVSFVGVGGSKMHAEGLDSLFPMTELSIMGVFEILPKIIHLKKRIRETAQAVLASGAQALITIDSPGFCLRVARIVKQKRPDFRTIHYVAPSVWAWRRGRARKMAGVIDHVLALLPFEPAYMTKEGMTCDFVGHPVAFEAGVSKEQAIAQFPGSGPFILALPGSRRGEVARLSGVLGKALELIKKQHPNTKVLLPTLPHVAALVKKLTDDWPVAPIIIEDTALKRAAFARADLALTASGSVSLELAANGCPMVVFYKVNAITAFIIRRLLYINSVTLVNIVSDTVVVPEFLQENCRPELIANAALDILQNGALEQRSAMDMTMKSLGGGGESPAIRAARSVLGAL